VVIAPAFAQLEPWARDNGIKFSNHAELVVNPKVRNLYEQVVSDINKNLAQYEKLKKFIVLPEELSIASGTLTPTLKLRRRAVEERYKQAIELMYSDPAEATHVKS